MKVTIEFKDINEYLEFENMNEYLGFNEKTAQEGQVQEQFIDCSEIYYINRVSFLDRLTH